MSTTACPAAKVSGLFAVNAMTGDVRQTESCKRTGVGLAPAAKAREELGCE